MDSPTRRRGIAALTAVAAVALQVTALTGSAAAAPSCPSLMVYGIQGTGQSSPGASTTADTGFLSEVFKPALAAAKGTVDRAYVPYEASFGGAGPSTPGQTAPYSESVQNAGNKAIEMIGAKRKACPSTKFGLVGYSQGAHAVRGVMNDVLDGKTAIKPEDLALVANFGDPGRPPGSSLFPERPGQASPSPVPGTSGTEVSRVIASVTNAPSGGGIGPEKDVMRKVGEVAGRYASFCTPGDLACDAPTSAPLTHLITNIAGQATLDQNDPLKSAQTIAQALAMTVVKTLSPGIAPQQNATTAQPGQAVSLSQRLATASDPRTPMPSAVPAPLQSLFQLGLIGGNGAVSQPDSTTAQNPLAALAQAGASSPKALQTVMAGRATSNNGGLVELVPPLTSDRSVLSTFGSIGDLFSSNAELFNLATAFKYWDAGKAHTSYGTVAATPNGKPPTRFVADWIVAAGKDIARGVTSKTPTTGRGPLGLPALPALDIPGAVSALATVPQAASAAQGQLGALSGIVPGVGGNSGSALPSASTVKPVNVPGLGDLPPFMVGQP